jgi:DNA polymerase-1
MQLIHVCNAIQERGIKIDRQYVESGLHHERHEIEKAREDFEKDTGRTYKNSSSLFAEIFSSRGEKFPRTEKGNPSFTEKFLDQADTPTAKLISRIRHHEKRLSTYWSSFLLYADEQCVIHPNLNQAGTVTGRFSSSNPNLQNIPKDDEGPYPIRGAFVPREGFKLVSIDYDQQEYRLMLDYAGERGLIDAVLGGEDVHSATARLLNIPRRYAKTVNFALLYGTGTKKLAGMLGIPESEAQSLKKLYFDRLPKVKQFIQDVVRTGETRGYIENWLGRKYWCGDFKYSYKLPNWLIQGGGADVIKVAMVQLHEHLKPYNTKMILQVHDELLFEIPEHEMMIINPLKDVMAEVYKPKNGMNLTCSHTTYNERWGK